MTKIVKTGDSCRLIRNEGDGMLYTGNLILTFVLYRPLHLRIMVPKYFRPNFIYLKAIHVTKNNCWNKILEKLLYKKKIGTTQMFNLRKLVKYSNIILLNGMYI